VKKIHDHTCQACGTRLAVGARGYSEAAHIRGLGRPHNGPDVQDNVLCLCPNCHFLFDTGALLIADDLALTVNNEPAGALRVDRRHEVDRHHITYSVPRSIHP
jgi:predicted restriction endonuclease